MNDVRFPGFIFLIHLLKYQFTLQFINTLLDFLVILIISNSKLQQFLQVPIELVAFKIRIKPPSVAVV
jgi:hypothetical protein